MSYRSEILAFAFGMLLIFLTFGDDYLSINIGNLDTIFGLGLWPVLDVVWPIATIAIFLLYGREKGNGLKINSTTVLLFLSFLTVLMLIDADDIAFVLRIPFNEPKTYWIIVMLVYPVYSGVAFFLFGKINQAKTPIQKK
jgi:branched-subunit amino acid permease